MHDVEIDWTRLGGTTFGLRLDKRCRPTPAQRRGPPGGTETNDVGYREVARQGRVGRLPLAGKFQLEIWQFRSGELGGMPPNGTVRSVDIIP